MAKQLLFFLQKFFILHKFCLSTEETCIRKELHQKIIALENNCIRKSSERTFLTAFVNALKPPIYNKYCRWLTSLYISLQSCPLLGRAIQTELCSLAIYHQLLKRLPTMKPPTPDPLETVTLTKMPAAGALLARDFFSPKLEDLGLGVSLYLQRSKCNRHIFIFHIFFKKGSFQVNYSIALSLK